MSMSIVLTIITAITICGTVANAFQKWWCFLIWICTNGFWIAYNIHIGEYQQALIYGVNLITSIIGLIKWLQIEKKNNQSKESKER